MDRPSARVPVLTLLLLCPIGAELLAAYDSSTGNPGEIAFALVFFAGLYGCPALLAREVARRTGRGWPAILLLAAALAILEAGVVDQSIFAEVAEDVRGWDESVQRTYVEPLGVSAYNTLSWVFGHVIYSFGAPIAIAEAMRPELARRPWLGSRGTMLAVAAWLGAAALIVTDLDPGATHRATGAEVAAAAAVAAAFVAAALALPRGVTETARRQTTFRDLREPFLGALAAATGLAILPDDWLGTALMVPTAGIAIAWLAIRAPSRWTLAHTAAAAAGALASRGLLAFLYFPLVGDTDPVPKYAHNVVLLVVVAGLSLVAVRRASAPG